MRGPPPTARAVALEALGRIEEGAYANLVVPAVLDECRLAERDRGFVTELVYGVTRQRRACDWLVDRFVLRPLDPAVRDVLRLGAYQLVFLGTPPHAAVSATVAEAPPRARGLVNAVLRRVASAGAPTDAGWPDDGTRLSYPDWIVSHLRRDLGPDTADVTLAQMNIAPGVTTRPDGYMQDLASQWVAAHVGVEAGDRVVDLCAAPGGKATWMAGSADALVVALDARPSRARLVHEAAGRLGCQRLVTMVADGRRPPLPAGWADRVLVDAPCSGLGVLRRRPDARWRVDPGDVAVLAGLQRQLLDSAATLARPGGTVTYSVCTLTAEETTAVDAWLAEAHPDLEPLPAPGPPWKPVGRGARLLPQTAGTDGMFVWSGRRAR